MSRVEVLADRELVELFSDRPELLAVADAIAATAPASHRRGVSSRIALLALLVTGAMIFALVGPLGDSRGGVLQRALAAVTANEALYVVLQSNVPGSTLVDLRTGRPSPLKLRVETWFDAKRGLKR